MGIRMIIMLIQLPRSTDESLYLSVVMIPLFLSWTTFPPPLPHLRYFRKERNEIVTMGKISGTCGDTATTTWGGVTSGVPATARVTVKHAYMFDEYAPDSLPL